MSDFKQQYKNPRPGFGNTNHSRILRASKHIESRREARTQVFNNNRKLQDVLEPANPSFTEDASITDKRMKKLLKWREERKKQKLKNTTKKPPFKVGIVHHSVYSPVTQWNNKSTVVSEESKQPKQPKQPIHSNKVEKRITRATEKRLLTKATSSKQSAATIKNVASTKYPMNINKKIPGIKKVKSFAPDNYQFRAPSGLDKMQLFGLVQIEQTPQEKGDFFVQNKSTKCMTIDTNEQPDMSSQKLYAEIPNTSSTVTKFKISPSSKLSNKEKLSERLNEPICDTNNVMPELNDTIKTRSSLKKQTKNFQDKSLLNNTDLQTPSLKKCTSSNAGSNQENYIAEDVIHFSPCLTLSRGKKNARKEIRRLGIGRLSSDEIPTKDIVMKNLNISVEEEERTVQYFKFLLNKETERLKGLCEKWLNIKLEQDVPEDAMYEINQAVGQTNLLINKKFERFLGLVEDCEIGKGEKLITCRDLQGFWDMTYMEVRNCDLRFKKLEQRQNRGWQEEECTITKRVVKKRMPDKKQIVSSKPSSLRSLIVTARKKKMEEEARNLIQKDTNINMKCLTPVRSKNIRTSLVQELQSSDNKKIKSPFITMKVSNIGKTPTVRLDDTISYINSSQTPGKSILKKSEELVNKEICVKSAHKVNFDDDIVLSKVSLDKKTQVKLNLSAALSKIDSLHLNELRPQESITVDRKLNFETDNYDDLDNMSSEISIELQKRKRKSNKSKLSVQNICSESNSDKKSSSNDGKIISPKEKLTYRNQHEDMKNPVKNISLPTPFQTETLIISDTDMTNMENHDSGNRILRNRTVTTNNTSISNRTSKVMTPRKSISTKENKSPAKSNKKILSKLSQKNENKCMTPNKDNIPEIKNKIMTENFDKKRRSSRKSVAFSAETCLVCVGSKPVLPMTPHTKRNRSKTPSRQSKNKHISDDDDLISWDTPKNFPNRITRSHSKN